MLNDPAWPSYTDPAPPLRYPDDSMAQLQGMRQALVDGSHRRLGELFAMEHYTQFQIDRTIEDLGFILDFLGASLYVDDPSLIVDFAIWLGEILGARGVPVAAARRAWRPSTTCCRSFPKPGRTSARASLR